ncbi:hypothetical protein CRENBAI_019847 [Crenichthys baileyi]|uniref:TOG domain-containing protein n=1 Tax=Crenichthys baileyi TaxID=28760 RepID=A0AAV9RCX9_9TELE
MSQEIHDQLLDSKNYQNRTNGVEKLKHNLSEVDIKLVPPGNVEEFINFLPRLLDDSNFKVQYGTLQVLNLLIQKLETGVDKFLKHIVFVALKALGDTRAVTRNEYFNVFQQLMKIMTPQQVLDLVIGNLKHKNSRVREDVLNIIMAAMLTHPRKDFNIPKLCFEVAPYLADSKKKVRHAALELFAVFDHCLETGKKQPLMKALDMIELNEDAEGLMAAVQARRARRILPKLTSEGIVEYGLVVPKPGQWATGQYASGADLDWVINGARTSSARSYRTEQDSDRLCGYGSLGSLTDDPPFQRRIVSAGKGKNKLPWESSSFSSTDHEQQQCTTPNGKCSEQVAKEGSSSLSKKAETYIPSFSSAEPQKVLSPRRRETPAGLRRSGSLNLDTNIFKNTNFSDPDVVAPKGRMLLRNPSVERTFSLPSNASTASSFLLPSYPLATCTGGMLTPTLARRHADSSLSMSNTWPNKQENSPQQQGRSPRREKEDTVKGDLFGVQSPRPLRASLVSSSSTSSFRRALSSTRATFSISPVQAHSHDDQRLNTPASQHPDNNPNLDPDSITAWQEPQEDEPLDMLEMMNSLRSVRNSAAKKRAKVSLSSPDPESPDSAVQVDLGLDSPLQTSPVLTSSASESGLSSLSSAANSSFNGIKTSPRSSASSVMKPRIARVPSAKLQSSVSMDFSSLQVMSRRNDLSSEVGVVGQRVNYCNGTMKTEEEKMAPSPPLVKPAVREPVRALKLAKGSQGISSCRYSPGADIPEGVIGRGMCGTTVSSNHPGVALSLEQGDLTAKPPTDPSADIYSSQLDDDDSSHADEAKEKVSNVRRGRNKTRLKNLDQFEDLSDRGDETRDKIRHRVRQMLSDSPIEGNKESVIKDLRLNSSTLTSTRSDLPSDESTISAPEPQSPVKCLTTPHHPSPPTLPPNPKNVSRLRRAPSLSRTRPSVSHSSDELCHVTLRHKKNLSAPSELCPFSKPDLVLTQSFNLLNSEDWEKKIEGLMFLRSLAYNHADTLQGRLHEVCLCLIQEVKNLRSGVSRVAVCTLGDLYTHLQRVMDQELEGTVKALLQKAGESNTFIRQDVDAALDCMVQHCTPTRSIGALLTGGISHLNPVVRKCSAKHLANLLEKVGAARLLSGSKDLTERILPAITKLAQDSSQEARYFGRRMLLSLSSHPDFDKNLEKYIPTKDLQAVRDTILTLRTKGLGEMPQDSQSARGRRSLPGSGTVRASSLTGEQHNQTNRIVIQLEGLVTELYPRKPQMVEQKVLPLLWHLLGTSTHSGSIHGRGGSVRSATAQLCLALHTQMESSLIEYAATQPANVQKGLNELLKTLK